MMATGREEQLTLSGRRFEDSQLCACPDYNSPEKRVSWIQFHFFCFPVSVTSVLPGHLSLSSFPPTKCKPLQLSPHTLSLSPLPSPSHPTHPSSTAGLPENPSSSALWGPHSMASSPSHRLHLVTGHPVSSFSSLRPASPPGKRPRLEPSPEDVEDARSPPA